MMSSRIWLSSPHMGGNELSYVREAFDSNWIAPLGPHVNNFESELAGYLGSKGVAALSSGTSAIHLSLIMLGISRGDEVICSSFTFSASANPIVYQGATPVFIDSEKESWNMDPSLLSIAIQDRIRKGNKPKAIILVHLYGMPAKLDEILSIAEAYDIPVIEDAAEALGSKYKGKPCGSFGATGILSFNGNKIITTSGGGALVSDNLNYVEKARFLATQARDNAPHYQHSQIGYNYRMSNVVAAIGRGQLEVLDDHVKARRLNNANYRSAFKEYDFICFQDQPADHFSNYWLTSILIDKDCPAGRELLRTELEKENIESRPLWKPMHLQPVFAGCPAYVNGTSEDFFNRGLCLPSGSNLSEAEFEKVICCIKKVLVSKEIKRA